MNRKFSFILGLLGLTAMAGTVSAAMTSVWSAADGNGTIPPIGAWYKYANVTSTDVATLSTTTAGEKSVAVSVSLTNNESAAGMGFALAKANATTDLSDFQGFCLTYSASQKFKFDVKQASVGDFDYNGIILPAHTKMDTTFVPFGKLAQEGWGKVVAFDPTLVEGLQFSYKQSIAAETKVAKNTIVMSSITLGNSCTTNAPNVKAEFAGYNGGSFSIKEGGIYAMNMAEVFEDADGGNLVITVKIESETNSVKLVDSTKYDQNSIIKFTTYPNPKSDAKVTLTATDPTKKTATFTFTLETEDVENDPVARNSEFKVKEDSVLKVSLSNRLTLYGSDADGDEIKLVLVETTKHGTLNLNEEIGTFTYTPDPDYFGYDTLSYKFVDVKNPESVSNVAYGIITVIPVNDRPEVSFVNKVFTDENGTEYSFGDTLTVDEDFDEFLIFIDKANVNVFDADGDDDYKFSAKASGVLNATYAPSASSHIISISAKRDSNGVAKVSLVVTDPEVAIPTLVAYIKVNPVADPITPVDDVYDVYQDSLNVIPAKKGVLANDLNPDKDSTSTLKVEAEPEHGKLTLKDDGSFTFEADADFVGEDGFLYRVISADGEQSKIAMVTLNILRKNKAPSIVEGVADTVGNRLANLVEDFTSIKKYTKAELYSWFTDDTDAVSQLKFSTRSDDSLLAPSIVSGVLQIKAVKNACGDAAVIVIATDTKGASTELSIPASITCVNDKPVLLEADTVYVTSNAWSDTIDLYNYVYDPDGDELEFTLTPTKAFEEKLQLVQEDSKIIVSVQDSVELTKGSIIGLSVKASDSLTYVSFKVIFVVSDDPSSIAPVMAAPKATWQNAILANRGTAAIFDLQGSVIWKQKLPVSEADVRNAAAKIQGRKILQVNKQTWTIK